MRDEKFILDATAGFRMMWFNKHHPNALYLDQRPECEPDIVGDFRDLNQFPDETFRLIVFDPPHIPKPRSNLTAKNAEFIRKFGYLNAETWQSDLKRGFSELWRDLKPYGILLLKWSNKYVSSDDILRLCSETPLFYQISQTRLDLDGMKLLKTLWFCFMKIPEATADA